ncbi:MAG: hypothetical protein GC203_17270 [Phenylobacterium sp.]|nr:hypothetical protein [Phenylobacterium sp.]
MPAGDARSRRPVFWRPVLRPRHTRFRHRHRRARPNPPPRRPAPRRRGRRRRRPTPRASARSPGRLSDGRRRAGRPMSR